MPSFSETILGSPGERIRTLRKALKIQRDVFCTKHDISKHSMRSWELGIYEISSRSLDKLVDAFQKEGLLCSSSWILTGKGPEPFFCTTQNNEDTPSNQNSLSSSSTVEAEAQFFLEAAPHRHILIVKDKVASFSKGDFVGGIEISPEDYKDHMGKWAIIQKNDGVSPLVLKILAQGDIDLSICAPVVWHRRV